MQLNPEIECRIPDYFNAIQSQSSLLFLALRESSQQGFLLGSGLSHKLCQQKMKSDLAIVQVAIPPHDVDKMIFDERISMFDRIGLVGEILIG